MYIMYIPPQTYIGGKKKKSSQKKCVHCAHRLVQDLNYAGLQFGHDGRVAGGHAVLARATGDDHLHITNTAGRWSCKRKGGMYALYSCTPVCRMYQRPSSRKEVGHQVIRNKTTSV